jgi:hypothetical protein
VVPDRRGGDGIKRQALGSGLPKIAENDKLTPLKNKTGYVFGKKSKERDEWSSNPLLVTHNPFESVRPFACHG